MKLVVVPIYLIAAALILTIISLGYFAIFVMTILSEYKVLQIPVGIVFELPIMGAVLLLVEKKKYDKGSTKYGALIVGVSVLLL